MKCPLEDLTAEVIEGFTERFLLPTYNEAHPIPDCHRQWWKMVCDPHRRVSIAAPRGFAKSTALNHAYGLAGALLGCHPFQLKVSKTYELACEKIGQAKETMIANDAVRAVFAVKDIERDRENDLIVRMEDDYVWRMYALGMGQAVRGKAWGTYRPSLISCDDIEDDEEVLNAENRKRDRQWFLRKLLPMGGDHTQIRLYGTILHVDSLLAWSLRMKSWLSGRWEACDDQVSEASLLWSEKFGRTRMLEEKEAFVEADDLIGFNMEYRNLAVDVVSGYLQASDFQPIPPTKEGERRPHNFYVGGDFAISKAAHGNRSCFTVGGLDPDGFLDIVDVRRGKWDAHELMEEMFSIQETWKPEEWFVESGMIFKTLLPMLEQEMRTREVYLALTPMIPIANKAVRGRPLQRRMRTHSVRFDTEASWYPEYHNELISFRSEHSIIDDQFDSSAWLAIGLDKRGMLPDNEEEEDAEEAFWAKHAAKQLDPGSDGRNKHTGY